MILWSVSGFVFPFLFDVDEDEEDDPELPVPKDNWDCVRHTTLDRMVITWNLFMLTLDPLEVIRSQLRQTLFRFPLYGPANT